MLPKKNRLTKKEFQYIYDNGIKIHSKNYFLIYINNDIFKISAVAPSKKNKKAVLRNKKRREVYRAIQKKMKEFEKTKKQIIFFIKNDFDKQKEKDIYEILNKII